MFRIHINFRCDNGIVVIAEGRGQALSLRRHNKILAHEL